MSLLREFKPALLFLAKFLVIYIVFNLIYGIFVESYGSEPDAVTRIVANQSAWVLHLLGYPASVVDHPEAPKIMMLEDHRLILNVFEGCNGINVMIVFIAFLLAFGGSAKALAVFLPLGLVVIHVFNLLRIGLLYHLALNNATHFYYYHKYFFTATIYLVVFSLWAFWVIRLNERHIRIKS